MSFIQAATALGATGVVNSLNQRFTYDPGKSTKEMRNMKELSSAVGIYTHLQKDAAALALIFGCGLPEVHSSGQYGHYNDVGHKFHIWFGGMLQH